MRDGLVGGVREREMCERGVDSNSREGESDKGRGSNTARTHTYAKRQR